MSESSDPILEGVFEADALELLSRLPDGCLDLVYIDPPFCTGSRQRLDTIAASESGDQKRTDFAGRYATYEIKSSFSYRDDMPFEEYLVWLEKVVTEIRRALKETGSMYLHLDWHASAHARLICDRVFGLDQFLNEIIWAYDFGGRARDKWARKHDTILWYAKGKTHTFNREAIERIPYMAPKLVGAEKAARGKLPTSVWWMTVEPTGSLDRTGYPTQKPTKLLERIITASSNPGDLVADFFGGSGTTAAVAHSLRRRFLTCDSNPAAVEVIKARLAAQSEGRRFKPSRAQAKAAPTASES